MNDIVFIKTNKLWETHPHPLVTIITSNYNRREVLMRCMKSVDAQTFKDIEYIVVDNGSSVSFDDIMEQFIEQTEKMLENAKYLKEQLDKINWPSWLEPMSNTVYFKRPSKMIVDKYDLAPDHDDRLGGDLAHIVVMQHVTKDRIDKFIEDLKNDYS